MEKISRVIKSTYKQLLFILSLVCAIGFIGRAVTVKAQTYTVSTLAQFKAAITSAASGDIIDLTENITLDEKIDITDGRSLTIMASGTNSSGGNVTITAASSIHTMFQLDNSSLTFTDLVVDGNNTSMIVYATGSSTLVTLDGTIFQNGNSQNRPTNAEGGAIHATTGANVTIQNYSTIQNNVAIYDSSIHDSDSRAHGGAIYLYTGTLNITDSYIYDNSSGTNSSGTVNVGANGGAIYANAATVNMSNVSASGNHAGAVSSAGGFKGGVLFAYNSSTVNITNSTFNVAATFNMGGAIAIEGSSATIADSTFSISALGDAYGISGGAISSANSYTTITGSTFTQTNRSKLTYAGGFIDVVGSGTFTLKTSTMQADAGNTPGSTRWKTLATYGGAIAFESGASVTALIEDTTIHNVSSDASGGAITIGTQSTEYPYKSSDSHGASSVTLTMNDVEIYSTATAAYAGTSSGGLSAGGAIMVGQGNTVTINGGSISATFSDIGGAIYNEGTLTITGGHTQMGGYSYQAGSGIYNNGYLKIDYATMSNNTKGDWSNGSNVHSLASTEYPGLGIYAYKDVIITPNADLTDAGDVRVFDGQSAVLLTGTLTNRLNVSISETEKTSTNAVIAEDEHRYIGYIVAKGTEGYTPVASDANVIHYQSQTSNVSAYTDSTSIGNWDYVYDPEQSYVVVGQRAKMTYHSNQPNENAHFPAASAASGSTETELEQLYTVYDSGNSSKPKMSVDNVSVGTGLLEVDDTPVSHWIFTGWYNVAALQPVEDTTYANYYNTKSSVVISPYSAKLYTFQVNALTATTNNYENYLVDFDNAYFTNTTDEVTDIIDPNALHVYAGWAPIDITINKVWHHGSNTNQPTTATVNLLVNGSVLETYTISSSVTISDLDRYKDDGVTELVYTVTEDAITDYQATIIEPTALEDDETKLVATVTNVYLQDFIVKKVWLGTTGTSATVNLLANGTTVNTVTLSESNDWTYTFADKPVYDVENATDITYTLTEDTLSGYSSTITYDTSTYTYTVTNISNETTSISVEKKWIGAAASSATFTLYANGETSQTLTLTADDSWSGSFKDLSVYDTSGTAITYTVGETAITGYTTSVSGDASSGYIFTNTNTSTRAINVEKVWVGAAGSTAKITLYADGVEAQTLTLSESNSWAGTFSDLPVYDATSGDEITYTVTEDEIDGYSSTITYDEDTATYTVTNTNLATTSVAVEKKWVGKAATEATFMLYADGEEQATLTLTEDDEWSGIFKDLSVHNTSGDEITYTVEEVELTGYTTSVSGDASSGYVFTNTNTDTRSITVEKVWVGVIGSEVVVTLYADGEEVRTLTISESLGWENTFEDLPIYDSTTGEEIVYTISEVEVDGYTTAIAGSLTDGFVITNTYIEPEAETTSISVTKNWVGVATSSVATQVSVNLYADGIQTQTMTLSNSNNWTDSFSDLLVYNTDGEAITYTISEIAITGYTVSITGNATDGFVITNTKISTATASESTSSDATSSDADTVIVPDSTTNTTTRRSSSGGSSSSSSRVTTTTATGTTVAETTATVENAEPAVIGFYVPKTFDEAKRMVYVILLVASAIAVSILCIRIKKRR